MALLRNWWPFLVAALATMIGYGVQAAAPTDRDLLVALSGLAVLLAAAALARDGVPPLLRARLAPELLLLLALLLLYGLSVLLSYRPQLWIDRLGPPLPEPALTTSAAVAAVILLVRALVAAMASLPSRLLRERLQVLPAQTVVLREDQEWNVAVDQVVANEIIVIHEGERVPFDGIVVDSRAYVDECPLTGDSATATKVPGGVVYAGSLNQGHAFRMQVQALGDDRALLRYIAIVRRSARRYRRGADGLASTVVGLVLLALALSGALVWGFTGSPDLDTTPWTLSWWTGVALLLAGAPWALSSARAVGYAVVRASAAELGALIAGNEVLPRLARLDHLCLDKTGTLTTGWPRLTDIEPMPGFTPHQLLGVCAKAEHGSRHPLALAIAAAAEECGIRSEGASNIHHHPGMGVEAVIDGQRVVVGSPLLLERCGIEVAPFAQLIDRMSAQGRSPLAAAIDGRPAGVLSGGAELRPEAPQWLAALRMVGIEPDLLSGDQEATVAAIAHQLGLAHYHAEWKPEQKAAHMRALHEGGRRVGFAAHVSEEELLAAAPLSIAVGTGQQLQVPGIDVCLPGKQLGGAARLLVLLRAVDARLNKLLLGLIGYLVLVLPLAAGLLYPSLGLYLPPLVAIGLSGSLTLLMAGQALALRRLRTGF